MGELLTAKDLRLSLGTRRKKVRILDDVSLSINSSETVAVVGESGCGKSTLARTLVGLYKPDSGSISFQGKDLVGANSQQLRELRSSVQMIFQDPLSSMNPRLRIAQIIAEPLVSYRRVNSRSELNERVEELLTIVGLGPEVQNRFPHQFSGGQQQRIAIARSLALEPSLLICDESVSSLDVSIQAQIINLLQDLQAAQGVSYLFISHDLSVVHHIADRVAVMYLGRIVETGPVLEVFENPSHPYTQQLLAAAPGTDPALESLKRGTVPIQGEPPSPAHRPSGCAYRTRCPLAIDACQEAVPELVQLSGTHQVACPVVAPWNKLRSTDSIC